MQRDENRGSLNTYDEHKMFFTFYYHTGKDSVFPNVSHVFEGLLDTFSAYLQPTHLILGIMKGTGGIFHRTKKSSA